MLNEAQGFFFTSPQLMVWPGAAIMLVVAICGCLAEFLEHLHEPVRPLRRPANSLMVVSTSAGKDRLDVGD